MTTRMNANYFYVKYLKEGRESGESVFGLGI